MFCQPKGRAGYIVSDCAVLDCRGVYREAVSKVAISTGRFPFAIGVTGNVHPHDFVHAAGAANVKTIKQLMKRLPAIVADALDRARARNSDLDPALALKGVAWDFAANAPSGFIISSTADMLPGAEPFVVYDTPWNINIHRNAATMADMLGEGIDISDPDQFDPAIDGLRLIESQRENGTPCMLPGMEAVTDTIGGGAQLYKVTKHGVTAELLRDWNDEIGKPLTPSIAPSLL